MLDRKLQLKTGPLMLVENPAGLDLSTPVTTDFDTATAVLIFAASGARLNEHLPMLQSAAASDKITWVAYPKAGRLATDLNRDIIRTVAEQNGLNTVRQIAVNAVWSALRLKSQS